MQCYFDYVENPITPFRKRVFTDVVSTIDYGDVLDLGCGQVGYYWSLGYASRVDSLSFYDYSRENIVVLNQVFSMMSPNFLNEQFRDTMQYIRAEHLISISDTAASLAETIVSKVVDCQQFDFLNDTASKQFDHVLALESLECVATEQEFVQSLQTAMSLLKPSGHLAMMVLNYDDNEPYTEELISTRIDGKLNPRRTAFEHAMQSVPHASYKVVDVTDTQIANYSSGYIAHVYK